LLQRSPPLSWTNRSGGGLRSALLGSRLSFFGSLCEFTLTSELCVVVSYEFASTGSCGVNTRAGMNGKRTRFMDVKDGVLVADVRYCYDWADRLTSSIPLVPGGNPVLGTVLSTAGTTPTLAYDGHGNTTRLADQSMTYDLADRHLSTTQTDGTVITYARDATGRVISRTTDAPGTAGDSTFRYTFGGAMNAVLDGNNTVVQRTVSLQGGVRVAVHTVRWHRILSRFLADGATTTISRRWPGSVVHGILGTGM